MKGEEREIYLNLTEEINAQLCSFCQFHEYEDYGCCEGCNECLHPLEILKDHSEDMKPGTDCWGFRPDMSLELLIDIVSAVISQKYNDGWSFIKYSDTAVTVYGRGYSNGKTFSSKVRIGHEGKPKELIPK